MLMRRAKGPWFGGYLEPKRSQKKSTSYSTRSTSMKRKSLIEAVSPDARDFIEAGTPKPQFVQTQPEKAEGKRHLHWFQNPQKQQLIRQRRKKYRRRPRSFSNLQTKFHHQCSCRRRFDYHSGLLRIWRGPENSERYRGWIEKGILGCR